MGFPSDDAPRKDGRRRNTYAEEEIIFQGLEQFLCNSRNAADLSFEQTKELPRVQTLDSYTRVHARFYPNADLFRNSFSG